ncbi:MAG: winged helix-turn-helix domain-containing protein [Nitrospira sp.]
MQRVAQLIYQQFGVRYHPCHVWKLLTQLGWSCQKPERRAPLRDDAAIARWKRTRWPHIKTPHDVGPIWSSSMNRASSSSRTWSIPRRRKDTRRSCTIFTNRIGSPRSVR